MRMPTDVELERFYVWYAETGWERVPARMFDFSGGGVGLLVDRRLPDNTLVHVAVGIATLHIGRQGRVVHAAPLDAEPPLWRVGVAFAPSPPSTVELLGARIVCWGAIAIALTGGWGQARTPGEAASLVILIALLAALSIGAELTHRDALRQYLAQRTRWEQAP